MRTHPAHGAHAWRTDRLCGYALRLRGALLWCLANLCATSRWSVRESAGAEERHGVGCSWLKGLAAETLCALLAVRGAGREVPAALERG